LEFDASFSTPKMAGERPVFVVMGVFSALPGIEIAIYSGGQPHLKRPPAANQMAPKDELESLEIDANMAANRTLDPSNWKSFRALSHRMLDDTLDFVQNIRKRPVWQPIPSEVRAQFRSPVPGDPADLAAVYDEFVRYILPFTVGNAHPGFMGWVHGGGTPVGMLAEMLAAGLNANAGGRDQIPLEVERQVTQWTREIFGFPESATGLFVTGTSMANLIGVIVARDAALGCEVRRRGVAEDTKRLTAYTSTAAHSCVAKAMDISGLGSDALRLIPTDDHHRIDLQALEKSVQSDRAVGLTPFLVIAGAGTVDIGAIDNLSEIADLCRREQLWFHVDGAFGALAKLASDLAPKLAGIERADSLAFDFHKWAQVPYDAGFVLVRDGTLHQQAFGSSSAYLLREERGMSAGSPWPCDYGPDLSRSFRALKTWATLKVFGTKAIGGVISRTCELARYLESRVAASPELELLAPVELNIVCFRYRFEISGQPVTDETSNQLNRQIVIELQESGAVAPSTTLLDGRVAIRAAIVNHRTNSTDIDKLIDATLAAGRARRPAPPIEKNPEANQQPRLAWEARLRELDEQLATLEALRTKQESIEADLRARDSSVDAVAKQSLDTQLEAIGIKQRNVEVALRVERALLLALLGRNVEARSDHLKVHELDPMHRLNLISLGRLLAATGYASAAQTVYTEAVKHHPGDLVSRVNLGATLLERGDSAAAREQYEAALRIDPACTQAHAGMSYALARLGDSEAAAQHRQKSFGQENLFPVLYRGNEQPVPVVLLVSSKGGNTAIDKLLDDCVFQTYVVVADFYDPKIPLPPHDLLVNSIGDSDLAADALQGAESIVAQSSAPVVNAPSAVRATGRCEIARGLSSVPGVMTPRTITLSRELLDRADAAATLSRRGFEFPLLLRTPGFHGGENFLRVEGADDLPAALAELPGGDLTAIQFLDARGPDGKTRKYRVMMIDGRLYPVHAAISSHWKIHYFSAEMPGCPEHRAEDAALLENMPAVLGPRAMAALEEIQRTLRLDYGGIDFGLNGSGDVLLFEANATMAVYRPGPDERWDYRRAAVEQIYAATFEMLRKRAASQSREDKFDFTTIAKTAVGS
jgi:aromatic-L-amino-acid decarboxylase